MKTLTLEIIKKNRVYFKCTDEKNFQVKLKITPESENLTLGTHKLLVDDISVRTKYGTDVIYSLQAEIKNDRVVTLKHRFNTDLVEKCKKLGGKWDFEEKAWVFSDIVEEKVEELDEEYNSEMVNVEITALKGMSKLRDSVCFLGYPVAKATGRDSGARICEDVSMLAGRIYSDGSQKNWATEVEEGSIFKLKISNKLLKSKVEDWGVSVKK